MLMHLIVGAAVDDPWLRVGIIDAFVLAAALRWLDHKHLFSDASMGRAVAVGMVLAGVTWAAGLLVFRALPTLAPAWVPGVRQVLNWGEGQSWAVTSSLIGLTVVCEELAWRGAVALPLAERYGKLLALALATTGYALAHLTAGPPVLLIAAVGAGALWTTLALWSGNLVAATVCHLVWDYLVFWLAPYA